MPVKDKGYGIVMRKVMRRNDISIGAKGVYAYLCGFSGTKGECFPTQQLMCRELKMCRSTLIKYIDELVEIGAIEKVRKTHGKFARNIYKISA